jgi:small subunit ribosomal protein S18
MSAPVRRKGRRKARSLKPKICRFCEELIMYIDFKDIELLSRYITEKGRILPRRITGTCHKHQKMLGTAIKRARNLSMIA